MNRVTALRNFFWEFLVVVITRKIHIEKCHSGCPPLRCSIFRCDGAGCDLCYYDSHSGLHGGVVGVWAGGGVGERRYEGFTDPPLGHAA